MKIKYDLSLITLIALFEKTTHAQVKDCFQDNVLSRLTFVVQLGELSKAVGKFGANVKHLEAKLKKKIRIVEFDPDKLVFIRHMVLPLQIQGIEEIEEGRVFSSLKENFAADEEVTFELDLNAISFTTLSQDELEVKLKKV